MSDRSEDYQDVVDLDDGYLDLLANLNRLRIDASNAAREVDRFEARVIRLRSELAEQAEQVDEAQDQLRNGNRCRFQNQRRTRCMWSNSAIIWRTGACHCHQTKLARATVLGIVTFEYEPDYNLYGRTPNAYVDRTQ